MFDKNHYKEMFRCYALANRNVTDEDAQEYCRKQMPPHLMASHFWLIDSCMQWFRWLKVQKSTEMIFEADLSETEDSRHVC